MHWARCLFSIAAALFAFAGMRGAVGHAAPGLRAAAGVSAVEPAAPAVSRSLGYPWQGRLRQATRLRESSVLRYVDSYREGDNFFGTTELVGALERAAQFVWKAHPGAKLSVGELSSSAGGRLPEHHSHQSGRDVDVAFFSKWVEGDAPVEPATFIRFWATGLGAYADRDKHFDDARNWDFVHSLLTDAEVHVQFIFVANTLRRRLLRQAFRSGASEETLGRAATVLREPSGRHPHKNHFHVRVYCPAKDRPACRERGPYWQWYEGESPYGLVAPTRRPPWLREWRMPN